MTYVEKRKISGQKLLADIRAGMTDEELKGKYGLSDKSLESAYRKLMAAGLLTEVELAAIRSGSGSDSTETSRTDRVNCPSCNAVLPTGATECPLCGVVLAKWAERVEREDRQSTIISGERSSPGKHWIYLVAVLGACIVVGAAFILRSGGTKQKATPVVRNAGTDQKTPEKKKRIRQVRRPRKSQGLYLSKAEDKPTGQQGRVVDFTYSSEGFPLGLAVSQGFGLHLFQTPSRNQGFKKFPPESGALRYYDEFSIAGATYLVITEESAPPKLYLDANRNGDLTDDIGPFEGDRAGFIPNHFRLQLPAKNAESGVPYRLWLFQSHMGGVRFYPACHWHAELKLRDKTYKMVLFDSNADGDYSNDPLVIDADNDGKASPSEQVKVGETIAIHGTPVRLLSVAPSGRWVALEF